MTECSKYISTQPLKKIDTRLFKVRIPHVHRIVNKTYSVSFDTLLGCLRHQGVTLTLPFMYYIYAYCLGFWQGQNVGLINIIYSES